MTEPAAPAPARETWLVAAWPGMGNVGVGAGAFLINKLSPKLVHELTARDLFDLTSIDVKDGLARPGRLPRSMFFHWTNPNSPRDLLLFIGEAQPPTRGFDFCRLLLDYAGREHRVSRVITFAAMATQLHPASAPRVFGVGTNGQMIRDLQGLEVRLLQEGQITGLNGVLLAAANERGLPGLCLLGELPFFAAAVPNPRASQAVLEIFAAMAGLELDFADLRAQAKSVEQGLLQLLEKMQDAARQQAQALGQPTEEEEQPAVPEPGARRPQDKQAPTLDPTTSQRIESLFQDAIQDRSKAFALKAELDRLGVFRQFEDRFLDLFKKGE